MGQIDSSPRFQWSYIFEIKSPESNQAHTLEISKAESTQEGGGVADPSRPSGPDNRNIYVAIEYTAWIKDKKGQLVHHSKLPEPFSKFVVELTKKAESGDEKPVDFFENNLENSLITWAKSEYSIELVSKGRSSW